jgi:hypothetical protein
LATSLPPPKREFTLHDVIELINRAIVVQSRAVVVFFKPENAGFVTWFRVAKADTAHIIDILQGFDGSGNVMVIMTGPDHFDVMFIDELWYDKLCTHIAFLF